VNKEKIFMFFQIIFYSALLLTLLIMSKVKKKWPSHIRFFTYLIVGGIMLSVIFFFLLKTINSIYPDTNEKVNDFASLITEFGFWRPSLFALPICLILFVLAYILDEVVAFIRKKIRKDRSEEAPETPEEQYVLAERLAKKWKYTEAVKWFRKAAEQGFVDAQMNLGVCYGKGEGVEKDEAEAVKWWRKAAEQGNAHAQFNVALAYGRGEGVAKDEAEGIWWLRKAAAQNLKEAIELLKMLEAPQVFETSHLSPPQKPRRFVLFFAIFMLFLSVMLFIYAYNEGLGWFGAATSATLPAVIGIGLVFPFVVDRCGSISVWFFPVFMFVSSVMLLVSAYKRDCSWQYFLIALIPMVFVISFVYTYMKEMRRQKRK